jgi:alanine racemase
LKPALSWTTEILDLKAVPAGRAVSYGCTFVTERLSQIAVLPVGYADGYPRLLSNRGAVLLKGQRAPIVGRVCMDLTMIDVTDIAGAKIGDTVTLMGSDGREIILADDLALWAETISYEILARITARVPRHYQE